MKRSVAVAAAVVGLVAPLVATATAGEASAAGETCRGLPATVVGSGWRVDGTVGDDVIVATGARRVYGGAGNDVICTLGSVAPPDFAESVMVVGGPGDDVVDRSGDLDPAATAEVFEAETVVGGPGFDYVRVEPAAVSSVSTGSGSDIVSSFGYTARGTVDLGPGDDVFLASWEEQRQPPGSAGRREPPST